MLIMHNILQMDVGTDTGGILIRRAQKCDLEKIQETHLITLREHVDREPLFTARSGFALNYLGHLKHLRGGVWNFVKPQYNVCIVAEAEYQVVAHIIYFRLRKLYSTKVAFICDISVSPEFRGMGLGRKLVEHVERIEGFNGTPIITASIWPENQTSKNFFESMEFELEKTDPDGPMKGHWFAQKLIPVVPLF